MPAVRRLLGAQRREALDRQRLPRRRAHRLRARRGRRQGPPHRAASSRRGWRASTSPARATTRWACAATTSARCASTTCASRPRTCSASRARASGSRCRSSTTGASALGTGVGRPGQAAARPGDRPRHRRAASSASRSATSTWSRTRSAGWSPTCSALESMAYLTTGLIDAGVEDYSVESAIGQGHRHRVRLVPGQPRAAARRRQGLHARPSPTSRSCATSGSSRSSRAPTTCCAPTSR